MPKEIPEAKFHSSTYDSIWLTKRMRDHLVKSLIEIDYEGIDWPEQEDGQEAHIWIYIRHIAQEGADSEFYVISYHDLDDDNGPYRLYSAFTLEYALSIRDDIRKVFESGSTDYKARREAILSPSTAGEQTPQTGKYKGKYINYDQYTPLIEKYYFVACEHVYWPGQDKSTEIVLAEIFGKVKRLCSRDAKGDISDAIVITYDFSQPFNSQHRVYEMPTMEEAIRFYIDVQPALKLEAIENLKKRLDDALKP